MRTLLDNQPVLRRSLVFTAMLSLAVVATAALIRESPPVGLGILVVAIAWMALGVFSERVREQGLSRFVSVSGFLWVAQYVASYETGPGAILSCLACACFWTYSMRALLTYPTELGSSRPERWLPIAFCFYYLATTLAALFVSRPEALGFAARTWWPANTPSEYLSGVNALIVSVGDVSWALLAAVMFLCRLKRMRSLDRRTVSPLVMSSFGLGLASAFIDAENGWYSLNPVLLLPEAVAGVVVLVCVCVLIYRHRNQSLRIGKELTLASSGAASAVGRIEQVLREVFEDSSIRVFYWDSSKHQHVDGSGVAMAGAIEDGFYVRYLQAGTGQDLAAITGAPYLERHSEAIETAAIACMGMLEKELLRSELDEREHDVQVAVSQRKQLERNLHDVVQQRILAARLRGSMAKRSAGDELTPLIDDLNADLTAALDALRELSRGRRPLDLSELGLAGSLQAVCDSLPLEIEMSVTSEALVPELQAFVYFGVCEALNNVVKHAGATAAVVTVAVERGFLRVEVSDNGSGVGGASAVRSLSERAAEMGGRAELASGPKGTTVELVVPRISSN